MAIVNLRPAEFALVGQRIHYAWAIVVITSVMRLVSSSFRMGFPVIVPIISEVFGWSEGLILFAFSMQWVVSGMFGPPSGWLGDRYGARFTMTLGASLYIAGMILTGFMTEIWQLYLFFGILLSASMGIFQVPLTVAVTSWFRRHLGLGMGLLQSSQGFGPVIAPPHYARPGMVLHLRPRASLGSLFPVPGTRNHRVADGVLGAWNRRWHPPPAIDPTIPQLSRGRRYASAGRRRQRTVP